jgi:hypothetical protein
MGFPLIEFEQPNFSKANRTVPSIALNALNETNQIKPIR